ncbi:MAG: FG-GAP-like repeat-containing protein [Archaeoglobaceae archaeon]
MKILCGSVKTRLPKPWTWRWRIFISFLIVLAIGVSVSSSQTLVLKEEIDAPANVVHVADLNQDGKNEVLVGTTKIDRSSFVHIYSYSKDGYKKVWSYVIPEEGKRGGVSSITTGDADNDGQIEIIMSTGKPSDAQGDSKLRIFDRPDGNSSLDAFEVSYSYDLTQKTDPGAIKVGDADNDGKNEVLVGLSYYSGKILQFKHDPHTDDYQVSTVQNTGSNVKTIDIADVNDDGKNEVVAGTSCWKTYDVRVLEYKGVYKNSWNKIIGYTLATTGNLNNDSKPEILAISGTHCGNMDIPQPRVWIFNCTSNFQGYSRYEEMWNESFESGKAFGQGGCYPVIGDLTGDEVNEFAFPMNINKTHKIVYVYSRIGGEFERLQTIEVTPSSLFIEDSDNNGVNELLICDNYDRKIKIYEKQEEQKKDKTASEKKNSAAPEAKEIASETSNLPGFEAVIALLGAAIALITRKWR